jgi:hypothetical protein
MDRALDRVGLAAALPGAGHRWVGGTRPDSKTTSQPDAAGDGAAGVGITAGAHALGTRKLKDSFPVQRLCFLNYLPFIHRVDRVGLDVVQDFYLPSGPTHFHSLYHLLRSQSEVQAEIVL